MKKALGTVLYLFISLVLLSVVGGVLLSVGVSDTHVEAILIVLTVAVFIFLAWGLS